MYCKNLKDMAGSINSTNYGRMPVSYELEDIKRIFIDVVKGYRKMGQDSEFYYSGYGGSEEVYQSEANALQLELDIVMLNTKLMEYLNKKV